MSIINILVVVSIMVTSVVARGLDHTGPTKLDAFLSTGYKNAVFTINNEMILRVGFACAFHDQLNFRGKDIAKFRKLQA